MFVSCCPGQSVLSPMILSAERPGLEALDTPHQLTHFLHPQKSRTKAAPSPINTPGALGTALVPTAPPTGGDLPSQAVLDLFSKEPCPLSSELSTRPTCLPQGPASRYGIFMELSKTRSPSHTVWYDHGTQHPHWRDLEDGVRQAVMLKPQNLQGVRGTGGCTSLDNPIFTPEHPARHTDPNRVQALQGKAEASPVGTDVTHQMQTSPARHRRHLQTQTSPTRYRYHPPDTEVITRYIVITHQIQTSRYRHHPPDTVIIHQIQLSRYRHDLPATDITHQ